MICSRRKRRSNKCRIRIRLWGESIIMLVVVAVVVNNNSIVNNRSTRIQITSFDQNYSRLTSSRKLSSAPLIK